MCTKYVLLCVCEREIEHPVFFNSYKEAWDAMYENWANTRCSDDQVTFDEDGTYETIDYEEGIFHWSAYCQNRNHDNIDWKISECVVFFDFNTQTLVVK